MCGDVTECHEKKTVENHQKPVSGIVVMDSSSCIETETISANLHPYFIRS